MASLSAFATRRRDGPGPAQLEDVLGQAEAAKEAGNGFLRRGDATEAVARYRQGLELLRPFGGAVASRAPRECRSRAEALTVALHLNAAQACLRLRDWPGAVQHADQALALDSQSVKAFYRRAIAKSRAESTLDQACEDFSRVLELDPQNKEAREQLQQLQARLLTFYDLLGAHPRATSSQIRQAYLREAKRWHPDKAAKEDKALATQRFKDIAEAHEVLRDAQLRQLYDLYLQYRQQGYIDLHDPEDVNGAHGGIVQVPFEGWADFRRILEGGLPSAGSRREADAAQSPADDPDDAPVSLLEWLLAGSALFAVWCVSVWRHNRHQWLKCMPLDIYIVHEEYSVPVALLMSPFFFGNVPWDESVRWFRTMVEQALMY